MVFDGVVCVFFFSLSFLVDLSRSEDVFWFVQFRKMVQLEEQNISNKNQQKPTADELKGDVVGKMI